MMENWQKFKEEFCRGCIHYFYEGGQKIHEDHVKVCHKEGGECKEILHSVILEAREQLKVPMSRDDVRTSVLKEEK